MAKQAVADGLIVLTPDFTMTSPPESWTGARIDDENTLRLMAVSISANHSERSEKGHLAARVACIESLK